MGPPAAGHRAAQPQGSPLCGPQAMLGRLALSYGKLSANVGAGLKCFGRNALKSLDCLHDYKALRLCPWEGLLFFEIVCLSPAQKNVGCLSVKHSNFV